MIRDQRSCTGARLLWSVVLAGGICPGIGGCGTMPDPLPESPGMLALPPPKWGSNAEAEAFKRRVRSDPFPTAAEGAAGSSCSEKSCSP